MTLSEIKLSTKFSFLDPSKFYFRLLIVTLYLLIVFFSEFFYRKPLFAISESVEINLQAKLDFSFFKFFSDFGTLATFFPVMILFYLIFPLNIPFLLFSVVIHSSYWDNVLKIMYGEERPYWVFKSLIPSCNVGFGNPSGHSMSSTAVYLSIWHIIINNEYFEDKFWLKIVLFFCFLSIIIIIIFSRLVLGAHSINQVLYGGLLGIVVYLVHFYLFKMNQMKAREFFELFRSKKKRYSFLIFYFVLFIFSLLFYFIIQNSDVIEDNEKYINENCKRIEDFKKFNEDGLFNALSIFALIGAHMGMVFFVDYMERKKLFDKYEEIYTFNKTKLQKKIYIFIIILISSSPLALFLIISGRMGLFWVYLFKIILPYFFGCFGMFGINLWLCLSNRYCNEKIFIDNEKTPLI